MLTALTVLIHMAIQAFSKYLNYKQNISHQQQPSNCSILEQVTGSTNSKYMVSLGSTFFFTLFCIGGFLIKTGTRTTQLFYFIPLECTAMSVVFPVAIILWNPRLRQEFLHCLPKQFQSCYKCLSNNQVEPTV